jgi:hypothetical protein
MESDVLERIGARRRPPDPPTYARRTVFVFVDDFDLATVAALRYARSLRPTMLRAVHFVIDSARADALRQDWVRANTGIVLDFVDCPDRRLARAAMELVSAEAQLAGVGVTAILPRRGYSPLLGRLLHDRTADKIASVVSRIPHAAATIVPFDVRGRLDDIQKRRAEAHGQPVPEPTPLAQAKERKSPTGRDRPSGTPTMTVPESALSGPDAGDQQPGDQQPVDDAADAAAMARPEAAVTDAATADASRAPDGSRYNRPVPPKDVQPMGSLTGRGKATVEGRVYAVEIRPVERNTVLAAEVADSTGQLTALFYGRSHIPGLICGARVRFRGQVGLRDGNPVMINPAYELVAPGESGTQPEG